MRELTSLPIKYTTRIVRGSCPIPEFIEKYVDPPRFMEYCKACQNYEKRWSCSPLDIVPLDFLNSYSDIRLIGLEIILDKNMLQGVVCEAFDVPKQINTILDIEKKRLTTLLIREEKSIPNSQYLFSGACEICEICTRTEGKPCLSPERMRYSIEAVGADISKISEEILGIKVLWMKGSTIPEHLILICGLLIK